MLRGVDGLARPLADSAPGDSVLLFNHSLRLFDLYITCCGSFHNFEEHVDGNREEDGILVRTRVEFDQLRYLKLVFVGVASSASTDARWILAGAISAGNHLNDFKLGTNLVKFIRMAKLLSLEQIDEMIKESFDWARAAKKDEGNNNTGSLLEQLKQLSLKK